MPSTATCPVCRQPSTNDSYSPEGKRLVYIECRICGTYSIDHGLIADWREHAEATGKRPDEDLFPYLSAYIRQSKSHVQLSRRLQWQDLAARHTATDLSTKLRRLLEVVASRSKSPGDTINVDTLELSPWIDSSGRLETWFLARHLAEMGLVQADTHTVSSEEPPVMVTGTLVLTVAGWREARPIGGGAAGTCFVAMWFDPTMDEAYDRGIAPALRDCGFRDLRVDRVEHNQEITDRILAGIRSAQFMVADFTGQRHGVYYEAGFAQGLGREVVRCCRRDHLDGLHFDTRQFSHVAWEDPEDLRRRLTDRIRATVLPPAGFG